MTLWCGGSNFPHHAFGKREANSICLTHFEQGREQVCTDRARGFENHFWCPKISPIPVWQRVATANWSQAFNHHPWVAHRYPLFGNKSNAKMGVWNKILEGRVATKMVYLDYHYPWHVQRESRKTTPNSSKSRWLRWHQCRWEGAHRMIQFCQMSWKWWKTEKFLKTILTWSDTYPGRMNCQFIQGVFFGDKEWSYPHLWGKRSYSCSMWAIVVLFKWRKWHWDISGGQVCTGTLNERQSHVHPASKWEINLNWSHYTHRTGQRPLDSVSMWSLLGQSKVKCC